MRSAFISFNRPHPRRDLIHVNFLAALNALWRGHAAPAAAVLKGTHEPQQIPAPVQAFKAVLALEGAQGGDGATKDGRSHGFVHEAEQVKSVLFRQGDVVGFEVGRVELEVILHVENNPSKVTPGLSGGDSPSLVVLGEILEVVPVLAWVILEDVRLRLMDHFQNAAFADIVGVLGKLDVRLHNGPGVDQLTELGGVGEAQVASELWFVFTDGNEREDAVRVPRQFGLRLIGC